MNIINQCYQELLIQHGNTLFQSLDVQKEGKVWQQALFESQYLKHTLQNGRVGSVEVQQGLAVQVPAYALKLISASCHNGFGSALSSGLLGSMSFAESQLFSDLLTPSIFLSVVQEVVKVPVINVGNQDGCLQPRMLLVELHVIQPFPILMQFRSKEMISDRWLLSSLWRTIPVERYFSKLTWHSLSALEQDEAGAVLEKY